LVRSEIHGIASCRREVRRGGEITGERNFRRAAILIALLARILVGPADEIRVIPAFTFFATAGAG
jgi:hypothetical protein